MAEESSETLGRRVCVCPIHAGLIKRALHLPEDVIILGAEFDVVQQTVGLVIEHKDLPVVVKGAEVPKNYPIIRHISESHEYEGWAF